MVQVTVVVFPTGVGMNRVQAMPGVPVSRVPHRRGDEPQSRWWP